LDQQFNLEGDDSIEYKMQINGAVLVLVTALGSQNEEVQDMVENLLDSYFE
jgi:hypothetical protein